MFVFADSLVTTIGIVLVAVIGGPIMWFLIRFDKRNSEQHEENADKLDENIQKLNEAAIAARSAKEVAEDTNQLVHALVERFDRHLEWHVHKETYDGLRNSGIPVPHRPGNYPDPVWNWPGFGE